MLSCDNCPHCGLRLGDRRLEQAGQFYRCRRCKGVVLLERKYRGGQCLFVGKPEEAAGGRELRTIPRV